MIFLGILDSNSGDVMSYRGPDSSSREKQLEQRIRNLSKNLERAEQKIHELKKALRESWGENKKYQLNLQKALSKSQRLDDLMEELKSINEPQKASIEESSKI